MAPYDELSTLMSTKKLDPMQYANVVLSTKPHITSKTVHRVKHFIWDVTPILPVLATIILAITVFLLILFRQSPGVVAGTVAGCLVVIAVYLFLTSLSVAAKYE